MVKNYLEGAIISGATLAKKKGSSHVQFKYLMRFISRCFNYLNRNFLTEYIQIEMHQGGPWYRNNLIDLQN